MRRGAAVAIVVGALASANARAADPAPGECIAASEASLRLRADGKLHDARAQLLVCAAASCPGDVRAECAKRIERANAAMPTVVFEPKDAAGNDLAAVRVTIDGKPLAERLEGKALEVDPGSHEFAFEAAGRAPVKKTMVVHEAEKDRHEKIVFGAASPTPTATETSTPTSTPIPTQAPASGRKTPALVVGVVGVAALGVGAYFGLQTFSRWGDSQNECGSPASCPQHAQAVTDHDAAQSAATVSTIAFAAGGVALAAAAVLWFTAPKETVAVGAAPSLGGASVVGRF